MATYGLEEEVFVVEPVKPSLASLYYLSRLLWRDPRSHYRGTASNFARGKDVGQGLMSGVEVSTGIHSNVKSLVGDLKKKRTELANAVKDGLIVPIGHLINLTAPTNVCALQIHIGGIKDRERVYDNLLHFLPVLSLITVNAPFAGREYYGQSYRIGESFAIGQIKTDKTERFQDIIIAKRLGTIEIRVPDPVWDLDRIKVFAEAVDRIVALYTRLAPVPGHYNAIRGRVAKQGYLPELRPLYDELSQICEVPEEMLTRTASDEVRDMYDKYGLLATYSAIDNGYREGVFKYRKIPATKAKALKSAAGLAGYYLPKLPYVVWKYIRES